MQLHGMITFCTNQSSKENNVVTIVATKIMVDLEDHQQLLVLHEAFNQKNVNIQVLSKV